MSVREKKKREKMRALSVSPPVVSSCGRAAARPLGERGRAARHEGLRGRSQEGRGEKSAHLLWPGSSE
jgi:hypothetical protein